MLDRTTRSFTSAWGRGTGSCSRPDGVLRGPHLARHLRPDAGSATGDDVLVTGATASMLQRDVPLVSRGNIPLKGKSEPLELFAPAREDDRQISGSRF